MRISDWSSDVCSSDLLVGPHRVVPVGHLLAARFVGRTAVRRVASRAVPQCRKSVSGTEAHQCDPGGERIGLLTRRQSLPGCFHCMCSRRSEEHTSELQSLMRISYAVFCLKKKKLKQNQIK